METVLVEAKPWWKSKTAGFNLLATALAVLTVAQDWFSTTTVPVPDWAPEVVVLLVALINVVLRLYTKQPITMSLSAKVGDAPAPRRK